jgi:hypothetical protein
MPRTCLLDVIDATSLTSFDSLSLVLQPTDLSIGPISTCTYLVNAQGTLLRARIIFHVSTYTPYVLFDLELVQVVKTAFNIS